MAEKAKDGVLVTLSSPVEVPRNPDKPDDPAKAKVPVLGMAVGSPIGLTRERIFVGPKTVEVLERIQTEAKGSDLRGLLDFGMFGFISRPLFLWLKWTYRHMIPNWGWAIGFLTLVINIVLLPLRISGIKSGLKMQKIQPQVKVINEKYKPHSLTHPRRAQPPKQIPPLHK